MKRYRVGGQDFTFGQAFSLWGLAPLASAKFSAYL